MCPVCYRLCEPSGCSLPNASISALLDTCCRFAPCCSMESSVQHFDPPAACTAWYSSLWLSPLRCYGADACGHIWASCDTAILRLSSLSPTEQESLRNSIIRDKLVLQHVLLPSSSWLNKVEEEDRRFAPAHLQARLACDDAQVHGWLLDGYPRSAEQAEAIEEAGIRPDIFILIEARLWNPNLRMRSGLHTAHNQLLGLLAVQGQSQACC